MPLRRESCLQHMQRKEPGYMNLSSNIVKQNRYDFECMEVNVPIETSSYSFPDKPRTTDSDNTGIPARSFDVFEKRHVVGVPNRDAKFRPSVSEENVQQEKRADEQHLKGKEIELKIKAKPKELDDDTVVAIGQHPIPWEDQRQSLNGNHDELEISARFGLSDKEVVIFDHEVADNLRVKINKCSKGKQINVPSISSLASNLSKNAKKKRKQKKSGHLLNVPKLNKTWKVKKTPKGTKSKDNTRTDSKNGNNQIAHTHQNLVLARTVNNPKIVSENGCGGSGSDEKRCNKMKISDDYDSTADRDVNMSSDNKKSNKKSSVQDDPVIAQVVYDAEQIPTVRRRWDTVKQKQQKQVSKDAIEKAKEELFKKLQAALSRLSPVYQKLIHEVSQKVIHSAYCQIEECPQGKICHWIKSSLIPHYLHHQEKQDCGTCQCVNNALHIHTLGCQVDHCAVWQCNDIKQSIQDRAKEKEYAKGTVLYSGTTIWKEGEIAFDNEDFCFLFKKLIGEGANGRAYRAWIYDVKTSCEADVALKEARYKLHDEAIVIETLGDRNPYILKTHGIIDLGARDNFGLVIMELCECSLLDYLTDYSQENNTRGLTIDDAMYFFVQIVDGVAYMHSKGVIHKDLKAKIYS